MLSDHWTTSLPRPAHELSAEHASLYRVGVRVRAGVGVRVGVRAGVAVRVKVRDGSRVRVGARVTLYRSRSPSGAKYAMPVPLWPGQG